MPISFNKTDVYPLGTAIVNGDLTMEDVSALNDLHVEGVALNGAYGWTGIGSDHVSKIPSICRLNILTSRPIDLGNDFHLPNLQWLYVGGNIKIKLNFENFHQLKTLKFNISNLKLIKSEAAKNLTEAHGNFRLDELIELSKTPNLKTLKISNTKFSDLSWLESFDLDALTIARAVNLSDLEAISSQKNLNFLQLETCRKLNHIDSLAEASNLRCLLIDLCGEIQSLQPLQTLSQLEILSLIDTNVLDGKISALAGNKSLVHMRFSNKKHYDKLSSDYTFDQQYFAKIYRQYESE